MSSDYPPFPSPSEPTPPQPDGQGAEAPAALGGTPDGSAFPAPTNAPYPFSPPNPAYPYPPNAPYPPYAPYAGYPPAGTPTQSSGAYGSPSGMYAPPPGESAPNSTTPGAGYPQYPQYPGYPPQDAYPPQGGYPPYAYPAAPSYPLYSPYAAAPYGAPAPGTYPGGPQAPMPPQQTPPTRRRRLLLPAILGGVAAVVIIAVVAVGLLALNQHGNPTTNANATPTTNLFPTATTQPTATAFPGSAVYSDAVPGVCGDHPNDWNTDTSGASVACANGVMTLTDPTTDKYNAAEFFQPSGYSFPASYAASVTVTNLTNACGGLLVLGNNAKSYSAYLCTDGSWGLYSYDSNGNPTTVDSGYYGVGGTYTLVMALSPGKLDVSINGTPLTTTQPTTSGTFYLGLQDYSPTTGSNATADFSQFVMTA